MYELTLNPFGLRYDDGFEDGENSNPYDKDRQIDILIIAVHNTLDFNHWISYTYVNNGIDLSHLFQVSHTLQRPTREIIEEFFYDDGLPFMVEKINLKYLGTLDHPLAKMLIDNTRNGIETVL